MAPASCELPHVLLIDDDKVDVKTVTRAFRKAQLSHPISVADNGVDALSMLRANAQGQDSRAIRRPVLILLDLNMPQMGGFEFLDELRADPQLADHVVFVMTTSDSPRDRNEAYRRHAAAYLLKSKIGENPQTFADMVGSYLRAVQLPQ